MPVFLVILCQMSAAFAGRRVALLIGNSAYRALAPMRTPANNVAAMKAALKKTGFAKVTTVLDAGYVDTIDATLKTERGIECEAVPLERMLRAIDGVNETRLPQPPA